MPGVFINWFDSSGHFRKLGNLRSDRPDIGDSGIRNKKSISYLIAKFQKVGLSIRCDDDLVRIH